MSIVYRVFKWVPSAAALVVPVIVQAQTVAITGGKIYPVSGPPIENGTVVITNGRITAVGASVTIPAGARRVNATGKWVTPGLVDATSAIGVNEIGLSAGYVDAGAKGEKGIAASFRVWEGFNPATAFLPPVRKDGITTIGVLPNRGIVQGQAAAMDLIDGTASEMILKAPVAMVGDIANGSGETSARGELIAHWRELLRDAKIYQLRKTQYEANQSRAFAASRADLEALAPVVNGTMPLWLIADRASDIDAALALAKEFTLKIAILGGTEAWMLADKLAVAKVPVMVGAMNNIPNSFNTLGARQENAGLLRAKGVHVVLISNGAGSAEGFNAGNLRYDAGNAVAYGMTWDDALRAATLSPAEALGVADKVGSLTAGKMGNVVIWSGDPFEFATVPEHVFIHGAEYTRLTRDEELTARYKTQPPAYRKPPTY
jgi:imidazolonepropionase-like amidohydrolase